MPLPNFGFFSDTAELDPVGLGADDAIVRVIWAREQDAHPVVPEGVAGVAVGRERRAPLDLEIRQIHVRQVGDAARQMYLGVVLDLSDLARLEKRGKPERQIVRSL